MAEQKTKIYFASLNNSEKSSYKDYIMHIPNIILLATFIGASFVRGDPVNFVKFLWVFVGCGFSIFHILSNLSKTYQKEKSTFQKIIFGFIFAGSIFFQALILKKNILNALYLPIFSFLTVDFINLIINNMHSYFRLIIYLLLLVTQIYNERNDTNIQILGLITGISSLLFMINDYFFPPEFKESKSKTNILTILICLIVCYCIGHSLLQNNIENFTLLPDCLRRIGNNVAVPANGPAAGPAGPVDGGVADGADANPQQ